MLDGGRRAVLHEVLERREGMRAGAPCLECHDRLEQTPDEAAPENDLGITREQRRCIAVRAASIPCP